MSALLTLAVQVGLPVVTRVLERRMGPASAALADDVLRAVADRVGAAPEQLETVAAETPGKVIEALREVERVEVPGMIAVYLAEAEAARAARVAEEQEPLWVRAWRPLGMYLLGFFWLWNIVLLHVANAVWKIALPPVPFDTLVQISGLYMGLYMGGHTVKDLATKWKGAA